MSDPTPAADSAQPQAMAGTCRTCGLPLVQIIGERTYHPAETLMGERCAALLPIAGTDYLSFNVPDDEFLRVDANPFFPTRCPDCAHAPDTHKHACTVASCDCDRSRDEFAENVDVWRPCSRGPCSAEDGHALSCDEASGFRTSGPTTPPAKATGDSDD